MEPLVSVGIPTYNRPEGLRRTLECITGQTYRNLEIIVSDNCSPDPEVERVVRYFMAQDERIQYFRQPENKGPTANFQFVLEKATGEYFMWAADDDVWEPEFLFECYTLLKKHPTIGMAFTNIEGIDMYGRKYREVPSFIKFADHDSFTTSYRYLMDPEFFGEANLFYSVFRRKLIQDVAQLPIPLTGWGADMCINLAALARGGIAICEKVLFKKRYARESDRVDTVDYIQIDFHKRRGNILPEIPEEYHRNILIAVQNTKYYWFSYFVMGLRSLEVRIMRLSSPHHRPYRTWRKKIKKYVKHFIHG